MALFEPRCSPTCSTGAARCGSCGSSRASRAAGSRCIQKTHHCMVDGISRGRRGHRPVRPRPRGRPSVEPPGWLPGAAAGAGRSCWWSRIVERTRRAGRAGPVGRGPRSAGPRQVGRPVSASVARRGDQPTSPRRPRRRGTCRIGPHRRWRDRSRVPLDRREGDQGRRHRRSPRSPRPGVAQRRRAGRRRRRACGAFLQPGASTVDDLVLRAMVPVTMRAATSATPPPPRARRARQPGVDDERRSCRSAPDDPVARLREIVDGHAGAQGVAAPPSAPTS